MIYVCEKCGQMVEVLKKSACTPDCCGIPMKELVAGTVEASKEKHIPVYEVSGNTVKVSVGSVAHPMAEEHYIVWVAVETAAGMQRKFLKPGEEPKAEFALTEGEEVKAVYAYCNLHGLWMA